MTILIGDNSPRVSYSVAEGVTQTSFSVPFEFFDNQDLNVYVDEVLKTLTTDYTVSGGSGTTGSINISVTGASGGSTVTITRDIALERTTDFPPTGPFQVGSLNTELDRMVAITADLKDLADRGLRLSDSDATSSLVLASKNVRKGTVLAFNATTGDVEVGPTISDTQSVADASADIATLADIQDGTVATDAITTVASISSDVATVSGVSSDVTTVAGQTTNMQNITDNLTAVQNAATNATNAASSASAAATSAANAATSETNASTSETNAATSATSAATAATNAATSETNAATSESNAASSATSAASSATSASTSATNAATSETNAATSETNAATSATNAATSASNASTSETNAASSAAAASASQVAAAASAASAANSYDAFDDRYLGVKSSDPTLDNDGNALVEGALYFNSTENEMRVYDGANWIAASSAGTASLLNYNYTATSGQTTFSGADDNANSLSYTVTNLIVTLNGIVLEDGTDYTATDGTSIVLAVGASANDELNVVSFKSFTTADMVSATNGGTFQNDIAINGDLTVDTNTLYVDSTNNNVGIGTASPNSFFSGGNQLVVGNGSGAQGLTVYADSASHGQILFADGTTGNEAYRGIVRYDHVTDSMQIMTAGASERLRVDSSGNVGIGTSSPYSFSASFNFLDVNGTKGGALVFTRGTNSATNQFMIRTSDDDALRFEYGSTFASEAMRLTSGGNLLIAKTTTSASEAGIELYNQVGGAGRINFIKTGSGLYSAVANYYNGTYVGGLNYSNTGTAIVTSSDYRLKKDWQPMTGATERVKALNPVNFAWKVDGSRVDGFLAHEAQEVVPEAVTGERDAMRDEEYEVTPAVLDEDGNVVTEAVMGTRSVPDYQGIDQSKLVPLLTAALQEAIAEIETLKTKVAALENA